MKPRASYVTAACLAGLLCVSTAALAQVPYSEATPTKKEPLRITSFGVQMQSGVNGVAGGISVNREKPTEGDSTTNAEAFFGTDFQFFTYDTPKTNISASFMGYPSLNVGGRVRAEIDLSLKREIGPNFTVGATCYDTYDSKPGTEGANKHDFGFTLSVGCVF